MAALPDSCLGEGASKEAFANTSRAEEQQLVLRAHPLTRAELAQYAVLEAASGVAEDFFRRGAHAELGLLHPTRHAATFARGPLSAHEKP
jgi:hypothetical protein